MVSATTMTVSDLFATVESGALDLSDATLLNFTQFRRVILRDNDKNS